MSNITISYVSCVLEACATPDGYQSMQTAVGYNPGKGICFYWQCFASGRDREGNWTKENIFMHRNYEFRKLIPGEVPMILQVSSDISNPLETSTILFINPVTGEMTVLDDVPPVYREVDSFNKIKAGVGRIIGRRLFVALERNPDEGKELAASIFENSLHYPTKTMQDAQNKFGGHYSKYRAKRSKGYLHHLENNPTHPENLRCPASFQ